MCCSVFFNTTLQPLISTVGIDDIHSYVCEDLCICYLAYFPNPLRLLWSKRPQRLKHYWGFMFKTNVSI